jgi:hypothetical protein
MIRKPKDTGTSGAGSTYPGRRRLFWGLVVLVLITWAPVLGIHLYRTSLADAATGTVVVVFPPASGSRELFRSVGGAGGSLVAPVPWFPRMWVARSLEPGFAGRLRERGAWGVYSTELLSARALLTCLQFSGSPAPPAPLSPPS